MGNNSRTLARLLGALSFAAMAGAASPAAAGVISVINPSFEILPVGGLPFAGCGPGCSYSMGAAIPGWTSTNFQTGEFQPGVVAGNFAYFNSVPDGITVAYTNGGTISQTLSAIAQAGVTYMLQVDMGFRKDVPNPGSVALDINGNIVFATGVPLQGSGDWVTYTAFYTASALDAGQSISIILDSQGVQGDWDNVRLSVPEPSTLALIGVALLSLFGLGIMRRRADS